MNRPNFKVLQIEDNASDARLVAELLSEVNSASFEVTWKSRLSEGLECLPAGQFDVILLDLELPDSFGLETVTATLEAAPRIPIIVMSSLKDEETAATAVQKGAQDYLVKGVSDPALLFHSIRYAVERKRAQEQIRESEIRFRSLFERSPDGVSIVDLETGRFIDFNDIACEQLGYTREEFSRMHMTDFQTDVPGEAEQLQQKVIEQGEHAFETRIITKSGEMRDFWVSIQTIELSGQNALYAITRDITERKRAETLLAESESRLLRAQEMAHLGSWELDLAQNRLVWSDEVYRIFGLEPRQFAATYEAFLQAVHPDDRAAVDQAYTSSIRDGRDSYEIEHRVLRPDGEIRYVHEKCEHFRDKSGQIVRSVGMVHDLTRRKQSEAALSNAVSESRKRWQETESLLTATRSVLENHDFQDAARPIFDACKRLVGATSGYVALLDGERRENQVLFVDPGDLSCSVDPGLPMPVRGLREIAYSTGKPVFENDFAGSDSAGLMPAGHAPVNNVIFVPLVTNGNAVGLIGLANKPLGFDQNDVRLVTAFAELMSVALVNAQARTSLEKSEERFRSITASASDAVLSANYEGNIVTWNQAAENMFGYSQKEAIGRSISMLMPDSYRPLHRHGLESFLATGEPRIMGRAVELAALRKDGAEFPIELSLSSWTTAEGTFFGSVIRDVTDRRQMFDEIETSRRFSEALNNISLILNSTLDFDEIVKDMVMSAANDMAAESAFLAIGGEGGYVFRYVTGLSHGTPVGSILTPDNAPLAAAVIESGETMAVSDLLGEPRFEQAARNNSLMSSIAAPILIKKQVAGVIAFRYHSQKRDFDQAQTDFVEKLSTLISLAMENAELYRSEKEIRAQVQGYAVQLGILHEIGISLNRESDRANLQDMIVRNAAELTSAGVCLMTQAVGSKFSLAASYQAPWYQRPLFQLEEKGPALHRHLIDMITDSDQYTLRLTDLGSVPWFPDMHLDLRQLLVGILRDTRGRVRSLILLSDKADGASFTKTDEEIVSLLAAQSSVAMTSAENFEKEHYVAETLQSCLLPEVPVRDDLEIGLRYRSASEVGRIGGDFYDIVEMGGDKMVLAIGDVCGKGLSAASHTAMVKFMLRAYLEEGRSPGDCLALLNNAVCQNLSADKFITLGLAVIDLKMGVIRYSLAGHPMPIIYTGNHVIELEMTNTIPLGVVPGYSFPSMEAPFPAATSIMMYTDGVIEAKSPDGEMFGHRRLLTAFSSRGSLPAQKIAESVVQRVMDFSGDRLSDDVALLVMRSLRVPAKNVPQAGAVETIS